MSAELDARPGAAVDEPQPLLRALNRGIVVGSVYATALALCGEHGLRNEQLQPSFTQRLIVYAVLGFLAGTIGGFSNTQDNEDWTRDLSRNLLDAAMIAGWTACLLLAGNLIVPFATQLVAYNLLEPLAALAGGCLLGGLVGEPVLGFLGKVRVKGRQPFLFVNRLTAGIDQPDLRFVTRVLLQTVLFGIVVALATLTLLVIVGLIALWLAAVIVGLFLRDGASTPAGPQFRIPKGGRLREDGVVVAPGFLGETPTGQKVLASGSLVEEGFLGDAPLGVKIAPEDGRVLKEGPLFDTRTEFRLDKQEDGSVQVLAEGLLGERKTGLSLDSQGHPKEEGSLFGRDAEIVIEPDGGVHKG